MNFTKHYSGHPMKKNTMGGSCGKNEREETCIQDFGG